VLMLAYLDVAHPLASKVDDLIRSFGMRILLVLILACFNIDSLKFIDFEIRHPYQ
jgi:hypothetical protein